MAAGGKVSPFVRFLCIALLLASVAGPAGALRITEICQGPCSDFPDCRGTCISKKFPKGGLCMGYGTQPPACCCFV
ncbi:hypothetical protein L3X38_044767 [Prunus dulcis]|uniref:Uncharacterized protein n=1 Tax=Prunus dulcis TaxID=3755 RepID=A0AAD4YNE9_PRUDU|nr:hypothetical protein L3X38_044767 [Prunus dulcis]